MFKRLLLPFLACIISLPALSAKEDSPLSILPLPVSISKSGEDFFRLTKETPLIVDAPGKAKERILNYAKSHLPYLNFSENSTKKSTKTPSIVFSLCDDKETVDLPEEGYVLRVTPGSISIKSKGAEGLFYGLVTLTQLAEEDSSIPEIEIIDYPRMEYRGVMLDISRNFRDKEFIKKQIDAMARMKVNRLHLHLTDAAGWRIEIESFPRLTEYAAWRPHLTWKEWSSAGANYISSDDPLAYGGYLTKEDAREIVEYAADRYITVIPEIELPSHSEEVTVTYPAISCSGEKQSDVCIGNEQTFDFFEKVFDEILEIFPSHYIHIGGDEASKEAWKTCDLCLKRMEEENLKGVDELQGYMIQRIEQYLNSKGREIIGWDEILEGQLAADPVIMSWRGTEGGIKAAEKGHKAIMTPGEYCYLDMYQDAPPTQPEANSGFMTLSKVYSYNPVPDSLPVHVKDKIIGIQGNLWCEYIPTAQQAEYMLYPRMTAIAEIGWTPQEQRDWNNFYPRALKFNNNLQQNGFHVFDVSHETGQRREALIDVHHLGRDKKVEYNVPWWSKYNANFEKTLTDGQRGGWSYGDKRWQGFLFEDNQRLDVTIDLEEITPITYVGADFMQIIGPGVWMPETVIISISENGIDFTELKKIEHQQVATQGLSFKTFSWEGDATARYVRYVAESYEGCLFTDEIIIK